MGGSLAQAPWAVERLALESFLRQRRKKEKDGVMFSRGGFKGKPGLGTYVANC